MFFALPHLCFDRQQRAFGIKVTVNNMSPNKEKESIERLGANTFLVSHNEEQMKVNANKHGMIFLARSFNLYSNNISAFRQQLVAWMV